MPPKKKLGMPKKVGVRVQVKQEPKYAVIAEEFETAKGQAVVQFSVKDIGLKCTCEKYEGSDFNCKIHDPVIECPNCHCIKAEFAHDPDEFKELRNYRCTICGVFYARNLMNGVYIYSP